MVEKAFANRRANVSSTMGGANEAYHFAQWKQDSANRQEQRSFLGLIGREMRNGGNYANSE